MSKEDEAPVVDEPNGGTTSEVLRTDWREYDYPSLAVAETVAVATNSDPTTMTPLYEYVDSDGLDDLLTGPTTERGPPVRIAFEYEGMSVSIAGDGQLTVRSQT